MTVQPIPAHSQFRAPRGSQLSCKGWTQEAALRLLLNSLDPELAEHPEELLIYDAERAARDGDALLAILDALRHLSDDETLLVQSGAVIGVRPSSMGAPRLVLADERAEPPAPGERESACAGLLKTLLRCAAAGWFYAGSQTALQFAHEIMAAAANRHFGGSLISKVVLLDGLDPLHAAFALGATAQGAALLALESDSERIKRAIKTDCCEVMVNDLDEALRILKNAVRNRQAASVGVLGNPAILARELAARGVLPDLILLGRDFRNQAAIGQLESLGAVLLDAEGILPADPSREPVTCVALSGEPIDIALIDHLLLSLFPNDGSLQDWILVAKSIRFQGLPVRVVWLGPAERARFATAINNLVAKDEIRGPIVFGRVLPGDPPRIESSSVDSLLHAAEGASWAAYEILKDGARLVSCALLLDGKAETKERIEGLLGAKAARR